MKKLKLKDLKVQSFVTSMDKTEKKTIKGGWPVSIDCNTNEFLVCDPASMGYVDQTEAGKFITCYRNV
jgi:hypothetical protein